MAQNEMQSFHSHGKLLITGEYLVLEGAKALALPTNVGQSTEIISEEADYSGIQWKALDVHGNTWLQMSLDSDLNIISTSSEEGKVLQKLLKYAFQKAEISKLSHKISIETQLEFERNWGLGSSSTLITNIAKWLGIDAYDLQSEIFGGSGYDVASALHACPLVFNLEDSKHIVQEVNFDPSFKNELFFVHLNKKQNSRDEIERFKKQSVIEPSHIEQINEITNSICVVEKLKDFNECLERHEKIISSILKYPTIRDRYFEDYPFPIKSLGAWGGDFILTSGGINEKEYFTKKGYQTVLDYEKMIYRSKSN